MGANSRIEWTTHTMNPWRGCARVHTGCANCYAERMSKRNPAVLGVWGTNGTRVVAAEKTWAEPLKWDKAAAKAGERHRVFCASLADVFEDWQGPMVDANGATLHDGKAWHVDKHWIGVNDVYIGKSVISMDDVRRRLFNLIDATPNLDWLLLTKRPENITKMWPETSAPPQKLIDATYEGDKDAGRFAKYRPNVWLLASVSDQQTADAMIPPLLKCRNLSPVLGLSMEPLVGPVDPSPWIGRLDWVIVGGESGHGARPMHPQLAIDIRNQCQAAGVPFFFKQGSQANWPDFKDFDRFPPELQVREFPKASVS